MEFNWRDNETFVSHWMLWDMDIAKAISETPEFKDGQKTVAKVTVNGVELSFASVEHYMQETYDRTIKEAQERFANLDKEVERRVKEKLKEEGQKVIDKMYDLIDSMNDIDSMIKPWYEKNA